MMAKGWAGAGPGGPQAGGSVARPGPRRPCPPETPTARLQEAGVGVGVGRAERAGLLAVEGLHSRPGDRRGVQPGVCLGPRALVQAKSMPLFLSTPCLDEPGLPVAPPGQMLRIGRGNTFARRPRC